MYIITSEWNDSLDISELVTLAFEVSPPFVLPLDIDF